MEERLQKFLARAGIASRRAAEALILEGRVTVNGEVIRKMGVKVDAATDEVRVDTVVAKAAPAVALPPRGLKGVGPAAPLPKAPAGAVYLLLNKPTGIITSTTDDRGRRTVLDIIPPQRVRIFPVGRLDEDSEGLLLLTSDGNLAQLLTHPRYEVPKTYDLRVRGEVSIAEVRQVERGVWLSEGPTGAGHMSVKRAGRNISHVVLTLREGKNREVRRIFARLKHPVLSLRRVALGPLELGSLKPGQVRRLSPGEVKALYAAALGTGSDVPVRPEKSGGPRRHGSGPGRRPPSRGGSGERRPFKKDDGRRPPPKRDGAGRPPSRSGSGDRRPFKGGDGKRPPYKRDDAGRPPSKGGSGERRPFKGGDGKRPPYKRDDAGRPPSKGGSGDRRPSKGGDGKRPPHKGGSGPRRPGTGGSGDRRPPKGGPGRNPRPGGRR